MFLSKIWFILVALLAGVAVTMALVAPRPAVQKLASLEGQRLDRAQYAAEQMLKVDAHKWIDRVSKLGRDAIISESLDSSSRGAGELGVIHKTIQDRFRSLIPDLAGGGISSLVAVDTKGRVIGRVGDDEKEYGDYVGGAEVVADALRGYLSDDVWGSNGHLVRVAAAPVLSKGRDRIVGAIYVGAETGTAFAERLKKNLDVDIALFLRGKPVAATNYNGELAALPEMIGQHVKEIDEVKRTPALPLSIGDEALLAVAAPFPGQAGQQQAYYVLLSKQPAKSDLASLLSNTSIQDLRWGQFPWIPIAGGLCAIILIGLALQRAEGVTPIRKMRKELQLLARGDIYKLQDGRYGGGFGGLARDVNAAIEHVTHAPGQTIEMAGKDLNAILAGSESAAGRAFDLPGSDSSFGGTGAAFAPSGGFAPPPPPSFAPPPSPSFAPPPPPSFAPPPAPFAPPPAPSFAQPPSPSFAQPPSPSFAPPPPFSAAALQAPAPNPHAPVPTFGLSITDQSGGFADVRPSYVPAPPGSPTYQSDNEATRVVAVDDTADEELHFRHIFDDFIATKRECGESIAGLTLDKFAIKLRGNKTALMSKHQCRSVRFAVYVKDGKAALKATPVRD